MNTHQTPAAPTPAQKVPRKVKPAGFPQFDSYACIGDSIQWTAGGLDLTAYLEADTDTRPEDSECYTPKQVAAWRNDEWFFVGVVVSASCGGVLVSDHAASLWGNECNFPSRRKNPNAYLAEVVQELEEAAIRYATAEAARMVAALSA